MKRKPGRPQKRAIGQHRWLAVAAAEQLRHAIKLFRDFASKKWTDSHKEHEAIVRLEEAYNKFGMTVCARVMQFDEPSEFLHQLGDELAGELKFSVRDYEIACAYWAPGREAYERQLAKASNYLGRAKASLLLGEHCRTFPEFKTYFKKLFGNRKMPPDFTLRRSIKRLGYSLEKR